MPLSSRHEEEFAVAFAFVFAFSVNLPPGALDSAGKPNSRSACSGSGVGVSNTNVSTIDPFDEPNDTLQINKRRKGKLIKLIIYFDFN